MAKILVAEDDPILGPMIVSKLRAENHTVELAETGTLALDILFVGEFDTLILDWNMPGHSGVEVLKEYRARGGTAPVLMLTARNTIDDKEEGFIAGSDDYLVKPFNPRELVVRVQALLRRTPTSLKSDILRVGDLSLDPKTRAVSVNDSPLELQPLEFRMLEFLMRHEDHVFNVDALMSRVWKSDESCSIDSVRMCIARLRKKLRGIPGCPQLETQHGAGYTLTMSARIRHKDSESSPSG